MAKHIRSYPTPTPSLLNCHIWPIHLIQVNLDMTDSMGPGKLVRHMQNPSCTYDEYLMCIRLGPSISSVISKFTRTSIATPNNMDSLADPMDVYFVGIQLSSLLTSLHVNYHGLVLIEQFALGVYSWPKYYGTLLLKSNLEQYLSQTLQCIVPPCLTT